MLRRSRTALRIGTHVDPKYAGFGSEAVNIRVVSGSDLTAEAGYNKEPLKVAKFNANQAFEKEVKAARENLSNLSEATVATAVQLISVGEVSEGMEMAEFIEKARGLTPEEIVSLLQELSLPKFRRKWTEEHDGNMMEGFKQTGAYRGYERTREADHLFTLLSNRTDKNFDDKIRITAYNNLIEVYCSAGYKACLQVPDFLYDRLFFLELQPTLKTYELVLLSLGLSTRMAEFDALWSWLSGSHSESLRCSTFLILLNCLCEAERYIDVEKYFKEMVQRGQVLPDAEIFTVLIRSIYEHSRHAGGTIPAVEEKKLVFIPTWLRQNGVHFTDLSQAHQKLVENALSRWTFRSGLAKTTEPYLEERAREYTAWNEGQRWTHISQDEMNTSMIEAGVRKLRGDVINERMRLDVQKGGGRGVIYPEATYSPVTRYDSMGKTEKRQIVWDRAGVKNDLYGRAPQAPSKEELARKVQFAKRSATSERRSSGVWKRR